MSRISAGINLHGIEITVRGSYESAEASDWDYPGSGPEIDIETATVGGVDVLPWIEAADWMELLETAILEYIGEPITDY
jgi:hypothetical protein